MCPRPARLRVSLKFSSEAKFRGAPIIQTASHHVKQFSEFSDLLDVAQAS